MIHGETVGAEALSQERAKRLRFPRLDVACRPVDAEAGDVLRRLVDRDGFILPIAGADPHAEFQFVVEIAARAERRRCFGGQLALAIWPPHIIARWSHR